MSWSLIGTQFCLQLSFGVLLALAFVPKAPVGVLFYRVMGTSALVPVLLALGALVGLEGRAWTEPVVLAVLAPLIAYPFYSGPVRGRRWGIALVTALVGTTTAVALVVREGIATAFPAGELPGAGVLSLATSSALATGAVAGSVGVAMVLGHWYLTVPNLSVTHLRRLNRVTAGAMGVALVLLVVSCMVHGAALVDDNGRELLGPTGLFYLGTRIAVGLLLPLLFAGMTASSLKFKNTRSATGILYASTVLVLIGTAVSVSLQDAFGVPL